MRWIELAFMVLGGLVLLAVVVWFGMFLHMVLAEPKEDEQ